MVRWSRKRKRYRRPAILHDAAACLNVESVGELTVFKVYGSVYKGGFLDGGGCWMEDAVSAACDGKFECSKIMCA